MAPTTIPARSGAHALLPKGHTIKILNPSGHQVVDCWAFPLGSATPPTWMSMAQSRSKLGTLVPGVGDTLIDTRRRDVLTLLRDTSPGTHDMLFPACDAWRYAVCVERVEAGHEGHDSCAANLQRDLAAYIAESLIDGTSVEGLQPLMEVETRIRMWGWTPEPLNLFMNVPVKEGRLSVQAPVCKPGDYVVVRAETECLVVMSACPNDLMDTNGGRPGNAQYEVLGLMEVGVEREGED